MQRRRRRPAPLVLALRVGPHGGLVVVFHGQDAIADERALQAQKRDRPAGIVADRFVMRGLAADHAAQRHEPVEIALRKADADRRRHLQRTGHFHHLGRAAHAFDHRLCPLDQVVSDIAVIGGDHDQKLRPLVESGQGKFVMRRTSHQPISEILRVPVISSP